MKIYLVKDYRGKFYSSTRHWDASMNLEELKNIFLANNVELCIIDFNEITSNISFFKDEIVLLPSSEDKNLKYKSFIEDVASILDQSSARLVPNYSQIRAHHNKVYMELYRQLHLRDEYNKLKSNVFGTFEEFQMNINQLDRVSVVKPSSGALSKGVKLTKSKEDLIKIARSTSKSKDFLDAFKVFIKDLLKFKYIDYVRKSLNREKFVVQQFIPDLKGDLKVLVYGEKFYFLSRENRENDFRASGGGKLNINPEIKESTLDYCENLFKRLNTPFISMDIAIRGDEHYLIEFQFLNFGNYTLEKSKGYFIKSEDKWNYIKQESNLETEFVNSILKFIS